MKKLLLTSFEPFGGESVNASSMVAETLPDRIGEWEIYKAVIPVVFGRGAVTAAEYADKYNADAILCLGQAAGRRSVTPEMVAINLMHARIPDNDGNCPHDEPIEEGAPAAYFSTLSARLMADAITAGGISGDVSYSAGTYVCNDVLYRLLHRYSGCNGGSVRVGFIHVPVTPKQAGGKDLPSMDTETAARAVACSIAAIS